MEQSIGRGEGIYGREVRDMWVLISICMCLCSYECVCVCVFVCVLGEVLPSLLCLYIKKNEICNLYGLAAGKKDLAHGVSCLDLSLKVLESQIFLANLLNHSADIVKIIS